MGEKTDMANKKRKMSLATRNTLVGLSFIMPNFLGFFIFALIPVGFSLILSVMNWDGFNPRKFGMMNESRTKVFRVV